MIRIPYLGLQFLQFSLQNSVLQPEVVVVICKCGPFGRKLDGGGMESASHLLPLLFVFHLSGRAGRQAGNHGCKKDSEKKLITETRGRRDSARALYLHSR